MPSTGPSSSSAAIKKLAKTRTHLKPSWNGKRLAPLPIFKSRKKARKVTTLFHRYTQLKEQATTIDEKNRIDQLIEGIGGQTAYQKASQVSTSYHSTSKWVLGCLAQNGWLYGIPVTDATVKPSTSVAGDAATVESKESNEVFIRRRKERRDTRLLEIGAINTELLDAAAATTTSITVVPPRSKKAENESPQSVVPKKYRLHVRAIDLHSMHDGIEEADFLSLPLVPTDTCLQNYDVIVCSMVLNCVPTASKRGDMLLRIVHFLRPGGLVYITIPKTCLNLSPYVDENQFCRILQHVGLNVLEHTKDSPKVAFFIGQKITDSINSTNNEWRTTKRIRHGRKYRNNFVIEISGDTFPFGEGSESESSDNN